MLWRFVVVSGFVVGFVVSLWCFYFRIALAAVPRYMWQPPFICRVAAAVLDKPCRRCF